MIRNYTIIFNTGTNWNTGKQADFFTFSSRENDWSLPEELRSFGAYRTLTDCWKITEPVGEKTKLLAMVDKLKELGWEPEACGEPLSTLLRQVGAI